MPKITDKWKVPGDILAAEGIRKVVTSLPVDHSGTTVYIKGWRLAEPKSPHPIIIVHDLGEHTGYYRYAAATLVERGYSVYTFDLRGHGRSGRRLGHAPSFNVLVKDLLQVVAWVRHREGGAKPVILGHGIGALIAMDFTKNFGHYCCAVVLSAPCIELTQKVTAPTRSFIRVLSTVAPMARIPSSMSPGFTRRLKGELKESEEHTTIYFPLMTARFTQELLLAIKRAEVSFVEYSGSVLFLCPEDDNICSFTSLKKRAAIHSENNVEILDLPGVGHQVFTEGQAARKKTMALLLPWLERVLVSQNTPKPETREVRPAAESVSGQMANLSEPPDLP